MALGEAILACLTERPMTGYELARSFDASIGFFWRADHQQIYRELGRLRELGHAVPEEVVQTSKPNKQVYSITPQGRAALRAWSVQPAASPTIKDDLLVRLYTLNEVDHQALRDQVATRMAYHQERLARFEHILRQRFSEPPQDLRDAGRRLGLARGLRYERDWVEWCEDALAALAAYLPDPAPGRPDNTTETGVVS
ncbi:MAG: PadR family transcriptional regulator [Proteobacteria bacterium]|nr:PadR family transcriptional regulator [Pseudomonadota bacterium]